MTASTDDPGMNDALTDLRAWSDALPAYDVEAGAARHVELLARGAAPADATAMVRGSRRVWWIIGGSAVLALGLVSAWPRAPESPSAERAFATAPRMPAPAPERVAVVPMPIESAIVPRSDAIAAAAVVDAPRRSARQRGEAKTESTAPTSAEEPDALERELAIVRRMRRALGSDPGTVLDLAAQADREIGRGVFAEERAALRVFALSELGDARTDEAAAAFLRAYGKGPFAARVARIGVDEAPTAEPQ